MDKFWGILYKFRSINVRFEKLPDELNTIINKFAESNIHNEILLNSVVGFRLNNNLYVWKNEILLEENIVLPQTDTVLIGFYSKEEIKFDLFLWNGQFVETQVINGFTFPVCNVILNGKDIMPNSYISIKNISKPVIKSWIFTSKRPFTSCEKYYSVLDNKNKFLLYAYGISIISNCPHDYSVDGKQLQKI